MAIDLEFWTWGWTWGWIWIWGWKYRSTEFEIVPGAIVTVLAIGLQKVAENSPAALVADAAIVNPAAST
jgi:hypothetical protein